MVKVVKKTCQSFFFTSKRLTCEPHWHIVSPQVTLVHCFCTQLKSILLWVHVDDIIVHWVWLPFKRLSKKNKNPIQPNMDFTTTGIKVIAFFQERDFSWNELIRMIIPSKKVSRLSPSTQSRCTTHYTNICPNGPQIFSITSWLSNRK